MRRSTAAVIGATAIAVPATNIAAATAATKTTVARKTFTGTPGQAHQWGNVEVVIVVTKTTTTNTATNKKSVKRKITSVKVPVSPNHTNRSVFINKQALPILIQETIKAQSAKIDQVSGASDSSDAFDQSLQSAITKSKAW